MNLIGRFASVVETGSTSQLDDHDTKEPVITQDVTASSYSSVTEAVRARRSEFTKPRAIRIKVGTWNVAACKGPEKDIKEWFVQETGATESHLDAQALLQSSLDKETGSVDAPKQGNANEQKEQWTNKELSVPPNDIRQIHGGQEIDMYVLGLQEIVDITSPTEAFRPYTDPTVANRYKHAFHNALPPGYKLVAEQQLVGLLLLIYASPNLASDVHSVSSTSIGTGLMGYMGNKGAVAVRIILGEATKLVFINSHMSAGTGKASLERRNWDASQIINRTRFAPIIEPNSVAIQEGDRIGDEDFAFWFGDLNYRLEGIPGDDVRRILLLHTRKEYGAGRTTQCENDESRDQATSHATNEMSVQAPMSYTELDDNLVGPGKKQLPAASRQSFEAALIDGNDPTSLQATINSLLHHDELYQQQKERLMFHEGWREGPITFLPTYKYDLGSFGEFDSSEKKRAPSWCDRILYRTKQYKLTYEEKLRQEAESRAKDEAMKAQGMDEAADDEEMLFEYDPDADGEAEGQQMSTREQNLMSLNTGDLDQDFIVLERYSSHQGILSSDHKPLDAVFSLKYDAVIPELKFQIQEQVARELDRVENEGRPSLTLVNEGADHTVTGNFTGVDFGQLRFEQSKSQIVTIANTGQVAAYFGLSGSNEAYKTSSRKSAPYWFTTIVDLEEEKPAKEKSKTDEQSSHSKWLLEVPKTFKIEPGDTCSLTLTAEVSDIDLVRALNAGDTLEDVLVIRVKDGPDHFLPVRASWLKSSHGLTIEQLIRIPEGGVRKHQGQHSERAETGDEHIVDNAPVMWSAPREIFRLTESIESLVERLVAEYSMLGPDLTGRGTPPWETCAGWPFDSESWTLTVEARQKLRLDVYEALDTDSSLDSAMPTTLSQLHRVEVVAESLLNFLRNMQDGVITEPLWTQVEHGFFSSGRQSKLQPEDQRAAILEMLSQAPNHSITFVLLASMLTRLAQEITGTHAEPITPTRTSSEISILPKLSIRRKTLELDPRIARRQAINASFASIFADLLIKVPRIPSSKRKDNDITQRREVIQMFLIPDTG